jgi:sugar phosphate isomerase/epimerase
MPKRLSFQLYSARNHPPMSATLEMLAKAGYKEVEGFGGYDAVAGYGGVFADTKAMRAMMDANGLSMPTSHCSLEMLERDKKGVMKIVDALGIRHLYCPYVMPADRPTDGNGWRAFGRRLAKVGVNYRTEGITFGWHNHDFEFVTLPDGKTPHEQMFKAAPALEWEMDIAWVIRGGADPVKLIKKYAQSITSVHIKDIAPKGKNADEDGWADVGHGTVDWKPIFAALKKSRVLHYVLEHDKPSDTTRFAQRSFEAAKNF